MTDKRYGLVHISKPLKDVLNSLLDTAESRQKEQMKKTGEFQQLIHYLKCL